MQKPYAAPPERTWVLNVACRAMKLKSGGRFGCRRLQSKKDTLYHIKSMQRFFTNACHGSSCGLECGFVHPQRIIGSVKIK
jgi:hypothetical protein